MIEPPAEDLVRTLAAGSGAEIRIRGSRFIALASPAPTRGRASKIVLGEQKKYHDATHHCWGWRALTEPGKDFAWNDDGEPSGTAGAPILRVIESRGLAGVVVVVTRYFGGTKLGTGGLARAYSQAAEEALDVSRTRRGMFARLLGLELEYTHLGLVEKLAETWPVLVLEREFTARVGLKIAVSVGRARGFSETLIEASSGRIGIEPGELRVVFPD